MSILYNNLSKKVLRCANVITTTPHTININTSKSYTTQSSSSSSSSDNNNNNNNNNYSSNNKSRDRDIKKKKREKDESQFHQVQTGYFTGTRYLKNKPKQFFDDEDDQLLQLQEQQENNTTSDKSNSLGFIRKKSNNQHQQQRQDDSSINNEKRTSIKDKLDQFQKKQKPTISNTSRLQNEFVFDEDLELLDNEKEDTLQDIVEDNNEIKRENKEMFNSLDPKSREIALKAEETIGKRLSTPLTEEDRVQLLENRRRKRLIKKLSTGINQYLCFRDYLNDEDKADILIWFLDRDINVQAPHGILENSNMVDAVVNILVKLQRIDEAITIFKSNELVTTSSLLGVIEGLTRAGRKEELLQILNENGERFNDKLYSNVLETIYSYANRHGFMFMKSVTKILTEKYETNLKFVQQFYVKNCVDRYLRVSDAMLAIEEMSKQGLKLGFAYNYILFTVLEKEDLNLHSEIMENIVNQNAQLNAISCQLLLEYFVIVNKDTYAHHENYQYIVDHILKAIKCTTIQTQAYLLFYNQIAYPEIYELIEPVLMTLDQNPYIADIVAKSYLHLNLYDRAMEWYTKRIIHFGVLPSYELVEHLKNYHTEDVDQSIYKYWLDIEKHLQLEPFLETQNIDFTKELNLTTTKHLDEFFKSKPNGQKHIPTSAIRSIVQQDSQQEMLQREKMLLSHIQDGRADHVMNFINYRFFNFKNHLPSKFILQASQCIANNLQSTTSELYIQLFRNCSEEQRVLLFNPSTFTYFFRVMRVAEQLLDLLKDFPAFMYPDYQKELNKMVGYLFSSKKTGSGVSAVNKYLDGLKIETPVIFNYISALVTHYNNKYAPNKHYKYDTQDISESMVKFIDADPTNRTRFSSIFKMVWAIDKGDFKNALEIYNSSIDERSSQTDIAASFIPLIHRHTTTAKKPDIKSYFSLIEGGKVKESSYFIISLLQLLASDKDYQGIIHLLTMSHKRIPELSIPKTLTILLMKNLMDRPNEVLEIYKLLNKFNSNTTESNQVILDLLKDINSDINDPQITEIIRLSYNNNNNQKNKKLINA